LPNCLLSRKSCPRSAMGKSGSSELCEAYENLFAQQHAHVQIPRGIRKKRGDSRELPCYTKGLEGGPDPTSPKGGQRGVVAEALSLYWDRELLRRGRAVAGGGVHYHHGRPCALLLALLRR